MATVHVIVRLRRTEGRVRVDPTELSAAVVAAVEDIGEVECEDLAGETATYDVTKVVVGAALEADDGPKELCPNCGTPVDQPTGSGRPRVYCSDACRMAVWRRSQQDGEDQGEPETGNFNAIYLLDEGDE